VTAVCGFRRSVKDEKVSNILFSTDHVRQRMVNVVLPAIHALDDAAVGD
jgi:hypothetical protein